MYCKNCGTEIPEGSVYCPSCGAAQTAEAARGSIVTPSFEETYVGSEAEDIASLTPLQLKAYVKIMSIICYTGWPVLLPIFLFKDKPYVRQHANNGLLLLILSVAAGIVAAIPFLGWIAAPVAYVYVIVMIVKGIIHAAKGQSFTMPILGGICILK